MHGNDSCANTAAGTYGTWSSGPVNNCPVTAGGATIDGWVQIDQGNEYAMMQAVSNQPISVDVTSGTQINDYSVSNAAQSSERHALT